MSKLAADVSVGLSSNNVNLTVPASVIVPAGSLSANFTASSNTSATGWIIITGTYNGANKAVLLTMQAPPTGSNSPATGVSNISCTPKNLTAGAHGLCRINLNPAGASAATEVQLSSSSAALQLPTRVVARRGQPIVEFQVDAVSAGEGIVVTATSGKDTAQETLTVAPDLAPIRVPGPQFVRYGNEVRFHVSAADAAATLSAEALPVGGYFDASAGDFWWTPDVTQLGAHQVNFTATGSDGAKATRPVSIEVDSGEPVATAVVNAASRSESLACSPGAIAAITGRWFLDGAAVTDASGASPQLGGVKVWANAVPVPILSASATELTVVCPAAVAGSDLQFVVENAEGAAAPIHTTARSATPGLYSLDGSGTGQALALLRGTDSVAMVQNYKVPSQPAMQGDKVRLFATGIDALTNIQARVGENLVTPDAVTSISGHAGLFEVLVSIPGNVSGVDIPLSILGDTQDGTTLSANVLYIAITLYVK
jgi:uncharacterized protein (TIGR03437 family)